MQGAEAVYTYKDANGRSLYQVIRFPKKEFRRLRKGSNGEEIWNWDGVQQVPYRLDQIHDKPAVIFVEGEKDVDNLIEKVGLPATCIAGGAKALKPLLKKQPDFIQKYFSGFKKVWVVPDNDGPGDVFAREMAEKLHPVTQVKLLTQTLYRTMLEDDAKTGSDMSDIIDRRLRLGIQKNDLSAEIFQGLEEFSIDYEPEEKDEFWNELVQAKVDFPKPREISEDLRDTFNNILGGLKSMSQSGNEYNAICPAHDDRRSSLSLAMEGGKILITCHAGCSLETICQSLSPPIKVYQLFQKSADVLRDKQKAPIPGPRPGELEKLCTSILKAEEPGEFNTTHLPPILQEYIRDTSELTEASGIIIGSTALTALGAQAGLNLTVTTPTYFVPLYGNLWCLSISESGSYKTTALNVGAQRLREREGNLLSQISDNRAELKIMQEGDAYAEDDIEIVEKVELIDRLESQRRVMPGKASWEACIDRLEATGGGVWLLSEFGAWLAGLETSHNKGFRQHITELYDVPEYFEDVTRGRGSKILYRPFVGISGVSTVEFLQGMIGKDDAGSGFLARFLLFRPPPKDVIPPALPKIQTKVQDLNSYYLLSEIYHQLEEMTVPLEYEFSPEAEKAFTHYHNSLFKRLQSETIKEQKILDPFVKRWSPGVIKIGLLSQFLIDSNTSSLSEAAIMSGVSMCLYAEQCTRYLFNRELGESDHQTKQRKVVEYIANRQGKIPRQSLLVSRVLDGGVKEYNYILESLEESGVLHVSKTDGRMTKGSELILTSTLTSKQLN
jgi:hypothetical protein